MRRLLIIMGLWVAMLTAAPLTASAAYSSFDSNLCSGDQANSSVCKSKTNSDPLTGDDGIIVKATKIVAFVGGVAAIIVIIMGGLYFITADGDSAKIASARSTVIGALIGLAVIALAGTLIVYVVRKLN